NPGSKIPNSSNDPTHPPPPPPQLVIIVTDTITIASASISHLHRENIRDMSYDGADPECQGCAPLDTDCGGFEPLVSIMCSKSLQDRSVVHAGARGRHFIESL